MKVENVLERPAFIPLGGSFVTFRVFYKRPSGNWGCSLQVIQSLKSGLILASGFTKVSISSINFKPKWQFYKIIHPPDSNPAFIHLAATTSYPSPIDTFSQGNFLFFFARSSIEDVGSAPAESKNRTGSKHVLSYQIWSIG